ncbi:MAG: flagellar protein FlaG [Nitrospirae bacterium]|nr:flagellar protein FlaG [Nitrospirota bacterium]
MTSSEVRHRGSSYEDRSKTEDSGDSDVHKTEDEEGKDTQVNEAVEQIENAARFLDRELRLEIEKDLNIMVVKIIDSKTEEIIRQIPPEELIELSKHAKDLKGLLINKEV